MNILGIVNDPLPAGYRVEVSDEGSPMKSATSTAGASLSQLNSPTLLPREVTGWGRGGTDVASPDHWEDMLYLCICVIVKMNLTKYDSKRFFQFLLGNEAQKKIRKKFSDLLSPPRTPPPPV